MPSTRFKSGGAALGCAGDVSGWRLGYRLGWYTLALPSWYIAVHTYYVLYMCGVFRTREISRYQIPICFVVPIFI